jgi:hypothetical protein
VLLSQDEARFPLVPTLHTTLGVKGYRPMVGTWDNKDQVYCLAALNLVTGQLTTRLLEPPARSTITTGHSTQQRLQGAFAAHLQDIARRYPATTSPEVVITIDNAPWHRGARVEAIVAAHPQLRRKRNKKVAIKPQLRRRTGAHRNMALVARCAHRSDLLEAGARPEERTSTTLCAHAHARPHPRRSVSRLALPAPLDGHAWYTVPPLLVSCTHRCSGQGCTATFLLRFQTVLPTGEAVLYRHLHLRPFAV